jgi:hypothetical protein
MSTECVTFVWLSKQQFQADSFFRSVDRSNGQVLVLNGDLYYSPNCTRRVALPPPDVDQGRERNIFQYREVILQHFHQPRWWTLPFGWISFIPLQPQFVGFPFDCLAHLPNRCEKIEKLGFALPQRLVNRWRTLDAALGKATGILIKQHEIPAVRPFSPWAYGYSTAFRSHRIPLQQAAFSRDWFVVWMGLLSFLIAYTESITYADAEAVPNWLQLLADLDFNQAWLAGIHRSTVCSFSSETPRAGAFLHLPPIDSRQPSVQWFCYYHIPVWYRWGPEQEKDMSLSAIAPLREQLQMGTTFLSQELSIDHSPSPDAFTNDPAPWEAFFAERDKRHARLAPTESQEHRQIRLDRQRMPPTSSAKVFEWLKNVKDPTRWDRTPVLKKERQDILDYYGSQQKRYDAWENEWDCCELFGPLDPDQEVDYDDLCAGHDETDPNKNAACPPPPVEGFADVSEDNSDDIPSSSPLQVRAVAEILSIHYGFVPPLSLSASPTSIDEIQQNKFLRSIGHTHSDGSLFSSNLGSQAIRFVQTLVNRHRPSADSWDLDHTNRKALISVP